MICEYCSKTHGGTYGSGRFCSNLCARGFSTKLKREEINIKIGDKLRRPVSHYICPNCQIPFTHKQRRTYCSVHCATLFRYKDPEFKVKFAKSLKGKTGGPRDGGGWGKHSIYLNADGENIHCQSNMEYEMCQILDVLAVKWSRNTKGFPYVTIDGKTRKYYPDFYLHKFDLFLETKGYITDADTHKMTSANIPNLIIVKTNKYRGNWNEIVKDPSILLNRLYAAIIQRQDARLPPEQ